MVDKKFKRKEYVSIAEELYKQKMTSSKAGIDFSVNELKKPNLDSNKENEDESHKNVSVQKRGNNNLNHV